MLAEERRLLCDELTRYFGGYLVHYGPHAELPPSTGQIQRGVRLGPPLPGVDIACEGRLAAQRTCRGRGPAATRPGFLPVASPSPARSRAYRSSGRPPAADRHQPMEPVGHPSLFRRGCLAPGPLHSSVAGLRLAQPAGLRAGETALRVLSSAACVGSLAIAPGSPGALGRRLAVFGRRLLSVVARKLVVGLRPLRQSKREPRGQLVPMPVAKVSRRDSEI